jgi:preprotein translocase subunit SecG
LALAYFGNLRGSELGGSSVLERAGTTAPARAPVASGPAAQIPATSAPASAPSTSAPPAPAASGVGQIPVK